MSLNQTYSLAKRASSSKDDPLVLSSISEEEDYDSESSDKLKEPIHLKILSNNPPFNVTQDASQLRRHRTSTYFVPAGNENVGAFDIHPRAKKRKDVASYETLCASSLSQPFAQHAHKATPSPVRAHVKNKWGKSAKNWSFWTAWDSALLSPSVLEHGDVKQVIEHAFQTHRLEDNGWEPLEENFIVVQVAEQNVEKKHYPFAQEIQLDAQQINLADNNKMLLASSPKFFPVKLLACAGLAEIFKAVINPSDMLIISGGYDLLHSQENPALPVVGINFNKERHTQIIRIPSNLCGRLTLYEQIEPSSEEKRFKFTYYARRGNAHRTVKQHRVFDNDEFCRKVTDTLAYSRIRWDFPVPVVRSASVHSLYQLLTSASFKMPSPSPQIQLTGSSKDDDYDDDPDFPDDPIRKSPKRKQSFRTMKVHGRQIAERNETFLQKEPEIKKYGHCSVAFLVILTVILTILGTFLVVCWIASTRPVSLNEEIPGPYCSYRSDSNPQHQGSFLGLNYSGENNDAPENVDEDSVGWL